jgi:cell wall-associated NlpC family hydrolase
MTQKINKILAGCFIALSLALISSIAMAASVPGRIVGADVKMRKAPGTSSGIITKLTNSNVSVVDKSNGWYKISFNKKTGWVSGKNLKLLTGKGTITSNGVNFRKSAGTAGKVISVLKKNTSVQVLDSVKGWNKVKIGSKVGYVSSKFVKATGSAGNAAPAKTSRSASVSVFSISDVSDDNTVSDVINYAKEFVGVRYVYGGTTPNSGFDCSGFIGYVYKKFGVKLNRTAASMYSNGVKVSKTTLKAGDLLFFDASARRGSGEIDHAGIYLGGNTFIHASSSNGEVRIQKLSEYKGTYIGAKRVF